MDLSKRPFYVKSTDREYVAETVIISTGAVAKRMDFPGSGEENGFWWVWCHSWVRRIASGGCSVRDKEDGSWCNPISSILTLHAP